MPDNGYEELREHTAGDGGEQSQPLLQATGDGQDIVQFSTQIFFGDESDEKVRLGCMRLGTGVGTVKAKWETVDGSAKAGEQYVQAKGEVVFDDGDLQNKSIWIELLNDDKWHATNEFKVKLLRPEGCMLGKYLHTVRVKVMDNNLFPSDTYPEVTQGEDALAEVSGVGLFIQYFLLNFRQPGMGWRTILTLLLDQMSNLNIYLQRWMSLYMVDVVFNVKDKETEKQLIFFPSSRLSEAVVLACLFVIPMIFLHVWDYVKLQLDVKGHSKAFIRQNLARRYLNYNSESLDLVDNARIMMAIMEDVDDVAEGYCGVLDLFQSLGTVSMLIFFTLNSNPDAWWIVAVMPVMMLSYVFLRAKVLPEPTDALPYKKSMVLFINEMLRNYKLIAYYNQRPKINEQMEVRVDSLRRNEVPESQCSKNDEYFPSWLGQVFVCAYIVIEAPSVLGHHEGKVVSLGAFLATIAVIGDVAGAFSMLYTVYLTVINTFDPVRDLTFCFNLPTDLKFWSELNEIRRTKTKQMRTVVAQEAKASGLDAKYPTDLIPIMFTDVNFNYLPDEPIFTGLNLSAMQGSIVGVYGGHGSGKDTLLQILGHSLFPSVGQVFIAGHLRVLQVTRESMMFETWSIWENLTFGVSHTDIDHQKVQKILKELHMPKTLQLVKEHLEKEQVAVAVSPDEEEEDDPEAMQEKGTPNWVDHINGSEKAKLSLARALIANPEVLVLHMPFMNYDKAMTKQVKEVLKTHRDKRGIGQNEAELEMRRPRSVFWSVNNPEENEGAEIIWTINAEAKTVEVTEAEEAKVTEAQEAKPAEQPAPVEESAAAPETMASDEPAPTPAQEAKPAKKKGWRLR